MTGIPRITLAALAASTWIFCAGRFADTTPTIEQADLFWLFTAASLTGSMLGAVVGNHGTRRGGEGWQC